VSNRPAKTFILLVVVIVAGIALMNLVAGPDSILGGASPKELTTAQLNSLIETKKIADAEWQQDHFRGEETDGTKFTANVPSADSASAGDFEKFLRDNKVPYQRMSPPASTAILNILGVVAFPIMLIALIYFLVLRPNLMNARSRPNQYGWTVTDELTRLADLHKNGYLSDEEFAKAKSDLLGLSNHPPSA